MKRKNILVIGTSHSQASCDGRTLTQNRWHDYISDHYNLDKFLLAKSGCSIEQQFEAVWNYWKTNPDASFDYCIIEGRAIQVSHSIPSSVNKTKIDPKGKIDYESILNGSSEPSEWIYYGWTEQFITDSRDNKEFVHDFSRIGHVYSYNIDDTNYKEYYVDYCDSYLQAVQVWSSNLALIELCKRFCKKVYWFSFDTHNTDRNHPHNAIGSEIIKNNTLFKNKENGHFPTIAHNNINSYNPPMENFTDAHFCGCRHFNKHGHKKLWEVIFYPRLEELGVFK